MMVAVEMVDESREVGVAVPQLVEEAEVVIEAEEEAEVVGRSNDREFA